MSPPSKTDLTQTQNDLYLTLGGILARLEAIEDRLVKGDEAMQDLAASIRQLACMQPVSECSDSVKPGGWGKPVTVGAGATAVIFFVFDMVQKYLQMKGLI